MYGGVWMGAKCQVWKEFLGRKNSTFTGRICWGHESILSSCNTLIGTNMAIFRRKFFYSVFCCCWRGSSCNPTVRLGAVRHCQQSVTVNSLYSQLNSKGQKWCIKVFSKVMLSSWISLRLLMQCYNINLMYVAQVKLLTNQILSYHDSCTIP